MSSRSNRHERVLFYRLGGMKKFSNNSQRLVTIPVSDVGQKFSKYRLVNPRVEEQIARSVEQYGQLTPVVMGKLEDRYELLDGFKRFRACVKIGLSSICATMIEGNERVFMAAVITLNRSNRSIHAFEEALIISSLIDRWGLTQKEIAILLSHDKSWVCRRLSLVNRLCDDVLNQVRLGLISIGKSRELIRLPRGNQEEVASSIITNKLTCRETVQMVSLMLASPRHIQKQLLSDPRAFLYKLISDNLSSPSSREPHSSHDLVLEMKELLGSSIFESLPDQISSLPASDLSEVLDLITLIENKVQKLKQGVLTQKGAGKSHSMQRQ